MDMLLTLRELQGVPCYGSEGAESPGSVYQTSVMATCTHCGLRCSGSHRTSLASHLDLRHSTTWFSSLSDT